MKNNILSILLFSLFSINAHASDYVMRVTTPLMASDGTSSGSKDDEELPKEENPTGWLAYLQSKGYLEGSTSLTDWYSNSVRVELTQISTDDATLSASPFGIKVIDGLTVMDPGLTHAKFLTGVTDASDIFFVNTLALKDVKGFSYFRNVDELGLLNTGVSNIAALKNASGIKKLYLDDVENKYAPKLPVDSPLCKAIISEDTILKMAKSRAHNEFVFRNGLYTEICQSLPESGDWIAFFHKFNAHLDSDSTSQIAASNRVDFDFYDAEEDVPYPPAPDAFDSDLPSSPLPFVFSKSAMRIDLRASKFTHVDFMSSLNKIGVLNIQNNFELRNLNGLSGLTEVTRISIGANEKLTDIRGLSNIKRTVSRSVDGYYDDGEIYIRNIDVPYRPSVGTPFCNGLRDGIIKASTTKVVGTTYTTVKINHDDICLN